MLFLNTKNQKFIINLSWSLRKGSKSFFSALKNWRRKETTQHEHTKASEKVCVRGRQGNGWLQCSKNIPDAAAWWRFSPDNLLELETIAWGNWVWDLSLTATSNCGQNTPTVKLRNGRGEELRRGDVERWRGVKSQKHGSSHSVIILTS